MCLTNKDDCFDDEIDNVESQEEKRLLEPPIHCLQDKYGFIDHEREISGNGMEKVIILTLISKYLILDSLDLSQLRKQSYRKNIFLTLNSNEIYKIFNIQTYRNVSSAP